MTAADVTGPQAPAASPDRIDLGRLVGAPLMAGLLIMNASGVVHTLGAEADWSMAHVISLAGKITSVAFYALLLAVFVRRSRAKASHPSRSAAVAALTATWLPFALPLLPSPAPAVGVLTLANVLLLLGLGFSIWSLRHLDRSFSMVAQARRVIRTGPYGVVRHPLYTGELTALLGTVLLRPSWVALAVWGLIASLQLYRVAHEEEILAAVLPDYRDYQRHTPQLVPLAVSRVWRRGGLAAH